MIDTFCVDPPVEPPVNPPPSGGAIEVLPGESLQAAVLTAPPGTTLLLTPDTDYDAPTQWPVAGGLILRPTRELPDVRIDPKALPFKLPRLTGAVTVAGPVHNVVFHGIELPCAAGVIGLSIGRGDETTVAELPDGILLDRCYVWADPVKTGRRGIAANGRAMAVRKSWIGGFRLPQGESQAINMLNGIGPLWVDDCYLEASGENLLIGGGDCKIPGQGPGLVTVRRSTLRKPPEWRQSACGVKNLLELKNCRGAIIEDNLLDGCWNDAQDGSGVLMTVRNQDGTRPDSIIQDVLFRRNTIANVDATAINIQGYDDERPTDHQCRNLWVVDNLILSGAGGMLVQRGWDGLHVIHNTFASTRLHRLLSFSAPMNADGTVPTQFQVKGLVLRANVLRGGEYGINGDGTTFGAPTLAVYAPASVFVSNGIEQCVEPIQWPQRNTVIPAGTLYTDALDSNYRITAGGPFDVPTIDHLPLGVTWAPRTGATHA